MKMKKKLCSLLALLCILSLTACGANSKIAADSNTPSAPQDMPTMSADSAPSAGWDAPMSEEGAFPRCGLRRGARQREDHLHRHAVPGDQGI